MRKLFLILLFGWCINAQAQLEIEIVQGNASQLPIAVIPFAWRAAGPPPVTGVAEVVEATVMKRSLALALVMATSMASHANRRQRSIETVS